MTIGEKLGFVKKSGLFGEDQNLRYDPSKFKPENIPVFRNDPTRPPVKDDAPKPQKPILNTKALDTITAPREKAPLESRINKIMPDVGSGSFDEEVNKFYSKNPFPTGTLEQSKKDSLRDSLLGSSINKDVARSTNTQVKLPTVSPSIPDPTIKNYALQPSSTITPLPNTTTPIPDVTPAQAKAERAIVEKTIGDVSSGATKPVGLNDINVGAATLDETKPKTATEWKQLLAKYGPWIAAIGGVSALTMMLARNNRRKRRRSEEDS